MRHLSAFIVMVIAAAPPDVIAEDSNEYIVTLECRGVVDEPCDGDSTDGFSSEFLVSVIAEVNPVRYRMRVTATPGEMFDVHLESGIETWAFSGTLTETDDGRIHVELRHAHKIESGTIPTESGGREPIYDLLSVQSSTIMGLDESIVVGGMLTHGTDEFAGRAPRSQYSREFMLLSITADSGD